MNKTQNLLGDIVVYNKYAKYLPGLQRRENWSEIVQRYLEMLLDKYMTEEDRAVFKDENWTIEKLSPLAQDILNNGEYIYSKKVLPSMRALQFSGVAIKKNEARIYNCSYLPIDDYRAFSELMFLLLGGTGVGYSVQYNHIEKLPEIQKPLRYSKYLIGDSIEGWSDAIKVLFKSYFGMTKIGPRFDFSDIRPKGSRLVTAGGKAPGPEPLRIALTKVQAILNEKENGTKLTTLEVHDICCHIADAVLAGGIRRAALISLFSMDDKEMATCKYGNWWELNPQRGRSNNSAVILRNRVKKDEFLELWQMIQDSNSGEPGIYFTDDPNYGTNPCCEISLRPFTFCNLTEINAGTIGEGLKSDLSVVDDPSHAAWDLLSKYQDDLNDRARVAAFFGTLQAGFTDFHYLRPIWQKNTEKDALIGVGITGICNGSLGGLDLEEATKIVLAENYLVSERIGINAAARTTTIKPSGTTSCVLGTSSGIHAWHSGKYIRNMQCKVGDDLYNFFMEHHPELIEDMKFMPDSAVIGIPQIAPESGTLRENENALKMLERVKHYNVNWVHPGHNRGPNTNNVSATISVDRDKVYLIDKETGHLMEIYPSFKVNKEVDIMVNEWDAVGEWMWQNKDTFNGLSVLPYDGGSYANAPFETVDDETFERKLKYIEENEIDLTLIREEQDNTTQRDSIACGPNGCEII